MSSSTERAPLTTLADLRRVLTRYIKARQSVVIYGNPGVGKTATIEQLAADMGRPCFTIHGSHHSEGSDFKFPIVDVPAKIVEWVQSVFPKDPNWNGLVFVDEFSYMTTSVQSALTGLFHSHERRIGTSYELPKGAAVIAAANRSNCGGIKTIPALSLRVNKIDFVPDTSRSTSGNTFNDEFCAHLRSLNLPAGPDVVGCIRCHPNLLCDFNADRVEDSPTPRGWTELAAVLEDKPSIDDAIIAAGKVGPSAADSFCAYRDLRMSIDPMDIIRDPDNAAVPTHEASLLWVTVQAVAGMAGKANDKQLDSIVRYLNRCPAEFAVFGMIDCCTLTGNTVLTKAKSAGEFLKKHGPLLANKGA